MPDDWKTKIFEEKSLWEVYRLSHSLIPKPKSNRVIFWLSALIFLGLFIWSIVEGAQHYTAKQAFDFMHHIANQSLILSIGILGFLITGFAIFASLTNISLFIALANIRHKNTNINRLQFVFFNFLNIFTVYIGLLSFCLFIIIGLSENSPLTRLSYLAIARWPTSGIPAIFFVVGILGIWLISAIVKLKSFIWNLYQIVLISIATEAELRERNSR